MQSSRRSAVLVAQWMQVAEELQAFKPRTHETMSQAWMVWIMPLKVGNARAQLANQNAQLANQRFKRWRVFLSLCAAARSCPVEVRGTKQYRRASDNFAKRLQTSPRHHTMHVVLELHRDTLGMELRHVPAKP